MKTVWNDLSITGATKKKTTAFIIQAFSAMAFFRLMFLVVLLQTKIKSAKSISPSGKCSINIAVVVNASGSHLSNVARVAVERFYSLQREMSTSQENIKVWPTPPGKANTARNQDGVNESLYNMRDLATKVNGAIFVEIDRNSIFLSSFVERFCVPAIGIFHIKGQPRTQESSVDFTRVGLPSIIHYAQVIREIMTKMEWYSLSLVLSADYEGKVLADAMSQIGTDEKWLIKVTFWCGEEDERLENTIKGIIAKRSDVIVVHTRETDNRPLFNVIQQNLDLLSKTVWFLSDATDYGISDMSLLPVGILKISIRNPHLRHDSELYTNGIYDALILFQTAFEQAHGENHHRGIGDCLGGYSHSRGHQSLVKTTLQETFFEGRSSLFVKPSTNERRHATFDIWNLRQDLNGAKHWTLVGFGTPTGLALDNFVVSNGSLISPPIVPSKFIFRVAVNKYYPWVQVKEPTMDNSAEKSCTGRGRLCYKYGNSSRTIKTTFCCFGASIDLLNMVMEDLHVEAEIYFTPDGKYGDIDEKTKTWNGIVQEVISGKADLAIDISMTYLREKYLDFVNPFIHLALNILVIKDLEANEGIRWNSWLAPFDLALWLSIVGLVNIILVVIWWIDRKSPTGHFRQLDNGEDGFTMLDSMSYVWGVAFSKDIGAEKTPHSISGRCVATAYAFFALIVVNTYCANLMAFLVQENDNLPISGIRDNKLRHPSLSPPDGFKLGIQRGSQEEAYFKFHSEKIFRDIYHVNLKVNLVKSFDDGLEKLRKREIHGLVGDYLSLSQIANNDANCSYSLAGPNFFNFGLGIALAQGSPWFKDVNEAVLRHQENGSIKAIEQRWFNRKNCALQPFSALNLGHFSGLFMAVVIVVSFCFCALAAEFIFLVILVRYGNRSGRLQKFIKRFVFNIRKGEENHLNMQFSYLLRRPRKKSWDITNDIGTQPRVLAFCNNACLAPHDQPNIVEQLTREERYNHTERQLSEISNGKPHIINGHMNGHIRHNKRYPRITDHASVTKL